MKMEIQKKNYLSLDSRFRGNDTKYAGDKHTVIHGSAAL